MIVKFQGTLPKKAHESDSGYDLVAGEGITILPRGFRMVGTGLRVAIPKGYHADVRPRSGLSSKGIVASVGLVDSGYRGDIKVTLFNHTDAHYEVRPGDRIAQLVLVKDADVEWKEEKELPGSDRGVAGIGSTGR